jgi:NO-binding membrane sensor protein with MHYT domain
MRAARGRTVGRLASVHQFAYGWINPAIAYGLSFLGCLLGLVLAGRAREYGGVRRASWLILSAVSMGGVGLWLMHFIAMLGFDVPDAAVRYNLWPTLGSLLVAVVVVTAGLLVVGFGRPSAGKIVIGGAITGIGVAAMHYTSTAAISVSGVVSYDRILVAMSVAVAVAASTIALWFAVFIRGVAATIAAALLTAAAACSMHYTAMAAVRVRIVAASAPVAGVTAFQLLTPIIFVACLVMGALAYSTVGFTVRRENAREEAVLARARDTHHAAAMLWVRAGAARHR